MRRRFLRLAMTTVLAGLMIGGCSGDEKTYRDPMKRFTISFPESWLVKERLMGGVVGAMPPTTESAEPYSVTLRLEVDALGSQWTSAHLADRKLAEARQREADSWMVDATRLAQQRQQPVPTADQAIITLKQTEGGDTTLAGAPAHWVIYSTRRDGSDYREMGYYLVHEGIGYSIICSAQAGLFDAFHPRFEKIARTLKLLS